MITECSQIHGYFRLQILTDIQSNLSKRVLEYGSSVWDPPGVVLQQELERMQKRAARFVTGNYKYETVSITGILGQLKWESLKKRRKDNRLILLYKGLKGKASIPTVINLIFCSLIYQQMTLFPKLGVVEISTQRHFRPPLLIQMFINVASSPRLSGIGMSSLILWSHLLKMQRIFVAKFTSLMRARDYFP